jgi:hypothetical protein
MAARSTAATTPVPRARPEPSGDQARPRPEQPSESVTFLALCPACRAECTWEQERRETRLSSRVHCPCAT